MTAIIDWLTTIAPVQIFLWALTAVGSSIGIVVGGFKLRAVFLEMEILRRTKSIQLRATQSRNIPDFSRDEIKDSVAGYVTPDCSQSDPSNSDDARYIPAVREQVFDVVDRFVADNETRHLFILAETGMGKTTFCLNYLYHRDTSNKSGDKPSVAIIPLGRPDAVGKISKVTAPAETILILDAFDEDTLAMDNAGGRISELMTAASSFQTVIITCRTQFFQSDEYIPKRTGVAVVRPRAGSQAEYYFQTLYLLPFAPPQIERYIQTEFPFMSWAWLTRRKKARALAKDVRELSARPMLLTLIPDLIRTGKSAHELFELYSFMIDTWMDREASWIDSSKLTAISKRLATFIYSSRKHRQTDRVTLSELNDIAAELGIHEQEWQHLRARSLLNRDSEGNIKFSHRSIMEYFFVLAAIDGDENCFKVFWSDFMRELFVSWGNTTDGKMQVGRAKEILSLDLLKLGLSPLSKPLDQAKDYKLSAFLQKPPSRSRIPREWRGYSIRVGESSGQIVIQDNEYGLIWEFPDFRSHDIGVLLMSQHEMAKTNLSRTLASKDQLLSLIEIEQHLGKDFLPRDTFMWLGDRLGSGRPIAVTISQAALNVPSAKNLGPLSAKDRHGFGIWAYEPAQQSGNFGAKAPIVTALPIRVAEVDRKSQQMFHLMTPAQVADYLDRFGAEPAQPKPRSPRATKGTGKGKSGTSSHQPRNTGGT